MKRFWKPRRIAFAFLAGSLLSAVACFLSRDSIETHQLDLALQPGYDAFGRSCLKLVPAAMAGTLFSILPVCMFSVGSSMTLALIASLPNERIRFLVRSALDTVSALPGFLIAMALGVIFPSSQITSFFGAALIVVPSTTRFFESQILKLRGEPYVIAAEAMGAHKLHIWVHHLYPLLRDSVIALLPFVLLRLILIETSISYLGLSAAPEHETWGRLLAQGKDYWIEAPWILLISALPLFLTLASFHLLSREEQN
jgi:ABC-type dipeptide/oligopeptide/nickel transport system permease subunit